MLNFVGAAVPAVVASFLNPKRLGLLWKVVTEAVQYVQSELSQAPPEVRKKEAYEFALASYDLADAIFGFHPLVDEYVKQNLIPAMIDGTILAFNAALWFESSKPVEVGGANSPVAPAGLAAIPGPVPPVQPDPDFVTVHKEG
ncbi:MAG: hypothetical protein CVV27_02395 [Candidatus Melainabacteria bacterium HGW-Melainabacteria-1]|nr:MAG: hypothetical protein CVV27_02395 [Candidatus Melainabacteria bacterium HGW-Melainabacteria-1]